jgi:hypothetical protein
MSSKQSNIEFLPAKVNWVSSPSQDLQPNPDVKAFFDRVHGKKSSSASSEDKADRESSRKSRSNEMLGQQPEGAVSQQALAQVLASQLPALVPRPDLAAIRSNSNSEVSGVTLAMNASIHLQARRDIGKSDNMASSRIGEKDANDDFELVETDSGKDAPYVDALKLDSQIGTQVALRQLQSQAASDNQHSSRDRSKGLLAQLIDELVDCLHVSERMRADDWQIVIKLKSEILQGTQLHLENYGRRLSIKLSTNNKQAYDLLAQERFDLQNTLRVSIDQHIDVITEKV